MSATVMRPAMPADPLLASELLAHLDAQIASAARLLEIAMAQRAAIRERDVEAIMAQVGAFNAELERRTRLEDERGRLLARAGAALRLAPEQVTLTRLTTLIDPSDAERARARSEELQRLLAELAAQHGANQALMRQELAFLDHLLNAVQPAPALGYAQNGRSTPMPAPTPAHRNLDLHA